jgi:hypothetical protein
MLLHLQIGNVRDNKFHHQDGTSRVVCQEQILGANLVNNNLMHGMPSNNLQDGISKCLLNNNSPRDGALKIQPHNNKHQAGDKCLLNNNSPRDGALKIQLRSSLLPGIPRRLLNSNLPHGMRKTRLNSNRLQDGTHQARLLNSLLGGTRRVQQVPGDNNRGTHPLLRLIHGASRVSSLLHLHLQRMEVVAVQVSRGHNQHK